MYAWLGIYPVTSIPPNMSLSINTIAGSSLTAQFFASCSQTVTEYICLLYTSDAADEEDSVDLGGRRIIKKKETPRSPKTELRV